MSNEGSQRRGRRVLLVLVLFVLIGLAGSTAWVLRRPKFAALPVPNPNAYDTFLAAGRLVTGVPPAQGRADRATEEELRAFVSMNEKALALAHPGYSQESAVPLGRMQSIESKLGEMRPFGQLGRVLACQAVLARREGRTSDAVRTNLGRLRLAHAVSHGGLLVDHLTGAAIEHQAIEELEGPLLPKLSSADARLAIAELERLARDREPVGMIANRDLEFSLSRQGLQMRVAYMTSRKTLDKLRAPAIKAAESAEKQSQDRARVLLARLALHAYALDHPEKPRPGNLEALVPSYLAEVPRTYGNERRLTLDDLRREPEKMQENRKRD